MGNNIVIYQTQDGQTDIDVRLENDTVWLSQKQMATLFEKMFVLSMNISIMFFLKVNWKKIQLSGNSG